MSLSKCTYCNGNGKKGKDGNICMPCGGDGYFEIAEEEVEAIPNCEDEYYDRYADDQAELRQL